MAGLVVIEPQGLEKRRDGVSQVITEKQHSQNIHRRDPSVLKSEHDHRIDVVSSQRVMKSGVLRIGYDKRVMEQVIDNVEENPAAGINHGARCQRSLHGGVDVIAHRSGGAVFEIKLNTSPNVNHQADKHYRPHRPCQSGQVF